MPSNILLPTEHTQFHKIRDKILSHDHSGLYDELLYQSGSLLINKFSPENESLLIYAIIAGNEIAFDLLFLFGFKWEENSSRLILDKLNQSTATLSEKICDRIQALSLSSYIVNQEALPKFSLPMQIEEGDTFQFKTLQSKLTKLGEKKYDFQRALSTLFNAEEFANLVAEAFQGKPFDVQIVNPDCLYSEGDCCYQTKTIRLSSNQCLYGLITTLIFELCNAANTTLAQQTFVGSSNANDFAYRMEQSEYLSYERYTSLLPILRNLSLASLLHRHHIDFKATVDNEYIHRYPSFPSYWDSVNKNHGKEYSHSEYYRRDFRRYQQLTNNLSTIAESYVQPEAQVEAQASSSTAVTTAVTDIERTFTPGYLASTHTVSESIEQYFTSGVAKSFLSLLKMNPIAYDILGLYQPAITQRLANQFNETKLLTFSRMNIATQTEFILRFAKANKQEIEIPNRLPGVGKAA